MRKFRVLFKKHVQRDADGVMREYPKGNVIEVEDKVDLDAMFPNRFEEIGRSGAVEEILPPRVIPNIDRNRVSPPYLANKDVDPYNPNAPALPPAEIQARKKEAKQEEAAVKEEVKAIEKEVEEEDSDPGEERELVTSKLGNDVTADFEDVAENDLAVIKAKDGNNYYVVDPAKPNKAINRPGEDDLTSKKMVKKFIKELIESE